MSCNGRNGGGGGRGAAPGGGEQRAVDGLAPSGGHVAVTVAPEPEHPFRSWLQLGLRAGALQIPGTTSRPASLSARHSPVGCWFLRAQRSWEAVPGSLGALGPLSVAPALGRGYGRGVLWLLLSRKNPRPPHPTVIPGALRAARAAAGEGRGLAPRGAHPQPGPRTPQTKTGGS